MSILLASLLLAACSGSPAGGGDPAGGDPPDDGGSSGGSSGQAAEGRPSGALIRIFNAYTPMNGEPGPVDVYTQAFVLEGAKPKLTIPYGTMSELFDPTVRDDLGNTHFSMYWAGTTGNGVALMSQSATLTGGEVITYFLTTAEATQESGRRFGALQAFPHQPPEDAVDPNYAPPGKGLLIVTSVGLDHVLSDPSSYRLFFGVGSGCLKAIHDQDFALTSVGPGTQGKYALDPGSYKGAVYDDDQCAKNPIVQDVAIEIAADSRNVMFVYAPKDGDFRAAVFPLEPKKP
jgi:hypothetical protein